MGDFVYGLDFGTNNSVLAILDKNNREVRKIFSEKSTIFFPPAKPGATVSPAFGIEAFKQYREFDFRGRYLRSIKSILNKSLFKYTVINGRKYHAEDLVALVLNNLNRQASEFTGEKISEVILGRPVIFDVDPIKEKIATDRLYRAAKQAGFKDIILQYEPVGAAYKYLQTADQNCLLFVADLGAGTSDFTVLKIGTNKSIDKNSFSKKGIRIGGDDFDAALINRKVSFYFGRDILYKTMTTMLEVPRIYYFLMQRWEDLNELYSPRIVSQIRNYYFMTNKNNLYGNLLTLVEKHLGHALLSEVENTKIQLSKNPIVKFNFIQDTIEISSEVQRSEFENYISTYIEQLNELVRKYLHSVKISPSSFDKVFLTGGSSLIPVVQEIFIEIFGVEKVIVGEAFNSVAEGLAYSKI